MTGLPPLSPIPDPRPDDDDDVAWKLQTAQVEWRRQAYDDALLWLRRAAEAALELSQWSRAADLNAAATRVEKTIASLGAIESPQLPSFDAPSHPGLAFPAVTSPSQVRSNERASSAPPFVPQAPAASGASLSRDRAPSSIPPLGGSIPPLGGSIPPLGGSIPPLGGSIPPLGGSIPPLGGSIPPLGGSIPPLGGSSSTDATASNRAPRRALPSSYDRSSIVIDVDDEVDLTDEELEELERAEAARSEPASTAPADELPAFSLEASRPLAPRVEPPAELPAFTLDGSLGLPPVVDKVAVPSADQVPPYLRSSAPPAPPLLRSGTPSAPSAGARTARRDPPGAPLRSDRPAQRAAGAAPTDAAFPGLTFASDHADDDYSVPGLSERELRGYSERARPSEAPSYLDGMVSEPLPRLDGPLSEPLPSLDGPLSEPLPRLDGPPSEPLPSLDGPLSEPLPRLDGPPSEPLPRLTLDSLDPIEELDDELVELDAEEVEEVEESQESARALPGPGVVDVLPRVAADTALPQPLGLRPSPLPPTPAPAEPPVPPRASASGPVRAPTPVPPRASTPAPAVARAAVSERVSLAAPQPAPPPLRPALDSISDEVTPPRGSPIPDSARVQFSSPSDLLEAAKRATEERRQRELAREEPPAVALIRPEAELAVDEPPAVLPPVVTKSVSPGTSTECQSIEGVDLTQVRGFSDLSDTARCLLVESARVEELEAGEEVCFFSVALVIQGWVSLMPAIADAACASAVVGEVVFTEGTLPEGVALRAVAGESKTRVAVWDADAVRRATEDCAWMRDELRLMGDGFQALAGAALGPLGERLDDALRSMVTARCEVRALSPNQILVGAGRPVPGLHIVGAGEVELVDAEGNVVQVHGAGEFLFAVQVLAGGPAPLSARAGAAGALVLFTPRMVAHELLVSVPPLLELLGE